jgi:Subtilase family
MPRAAANVDPKHFFLNENHELARGAKEGGGRVPEFVGINWGTKGTRISHSLLRVRDIIKRSPDPLRDSRYFVLARPIHQLEKKSKDKRKAQAGKLAVNIDYSEDDSRVFGRLGLDLIQVNPDGSATVHALPSRFEQLLHSSELLEALGSREKARWATLDSFESVPHRFILDQDWFKDLKVKALADTVIELQPLLTTVETDQVTRAVAEVLRRPSGELLQGIGTDFSGRRWLRGKLLPDSLAQLAKGFFSIQTIHAPLFAAFVASPPQRTVKVVAPKLAPPIPVADLPCVAVVDTGVPTQHLHLAAYRRGQYIAPAPAVGSASGDHGSFVASRVVFGDLDCTTGPPSNPTPECSFYDVNIALDNNTTDEKSVLPALTAIVGVAPDVRVFNFSFDNRRPLDSETPIVRREKLILVQDLDNFIFANDVLVIVAAGNSPPGLVPATLYPGHLDQREWSLGTWPRSFNALTCGSFTDRPHPDGLAPEPGAPSPFTKVGPGICESPKPDFAEHGGNGNAAYHFQPGLGVWGCTAAGQWEDRAGTSFAAPLLARQAAITLRHLQRFCEPGSRPFAVAAKAYLALTATQQQLSPALSPLAERTLGRGRASSRWLPRARPDRAMIMWQGILDGPGEIVRVQLPVPTEWRAAAAAPRLRIVVAWDSPVNAAVEKLWASRKIGIQLRVRLGTEALTGSRGGHKSHKTYPLIERIYDLNRLPEDVVPADDLWLLEFSYEPAAEYYPGFTFSPQQRLAFAAELYDDGEAPLSPQATLQALPAAATMVRFSAGAIGIRNPVILRTRV